MCPRLTYHAAALEEYSGWFARHPDDMTMLALAVKLYEHHALSFIDAIDALDGYEDFKRGAA